jgi:hypothetical protein
MKDLDPLACFLPRKAPRHWEDFPMQAVWCVNVLLDRSRNVIFLNKPKNVGTGPKRTLSFKSKKNKDVEIQYQ